MLASCRWLRVSAFVLTVAFLSGSLWALRWSGDLSTATPDTFWYARDAFRYAGYSEANADLAAAKITCGAMSHARDRRKDFDSCLLKRSDLPARAPVRFQRIFTSRPGYALAMAPLVRVMGGAGFLVGSALLGMACGAAVVVLALAIGLRPTQAWLAQVAFYLLPTGLWVSRMLAEAPMVLCVLVATIGTVLLLRGHRTILATSLLITGQICLCVVKPANAVALAAALLVFAAVRAPFTHARRDYLRVAASAGVVLAGNLLLSGMLGLPGLNETLQDTFTDHFRRPDVTDPWHRLAVAMGRLCGEHITLQMLDNPLVPAAYVAGAAGLFWRARSEIATLLFAVGLTGAVVALMHPLASETARLAVVTWIPVAFGLAVLMSGSHGIGIQRQRRSPSEPPANAGEDPSASTASLS